MIGKRILYTGAAGGLGFPTTLALLSQGAEVIVLDRDHSRNEHTVAELPAEARSRLHLVRVDLADRAALQSALDDVLRGGAVDAVINNAAIYPAKPFEGYGMDEHAAVHAVNVEAALLCTKAALAGMREKGWGRIINITSITLSGEWENLAPYVQSKGALLGLTRAWAREFGKWGITVNAIAPGAFPTDAEKIHPDPKGYNAMVLDRQAIKRRGDPADIAHAITFLLSDAAGFITGQSLAVNGGWTMG